MQTDITPSRRKTEAGKHAESVLKACVHCGFCLATCPTYKLTGNELDSPRGRIYQIKHLLEGNAPSERTQLHLDRCLTCRNCETTCPSGVQYASLLDIGRAEVEASVERPLGQRLLRWSLASFVAEPRLMTPAMRVGQWLRPLLPASVRGHVPPRVAPGTRPKIRHSRRMIGLGGCVQTGAMPNINAAAARVLDKLGISLVESTDARCCGAVRHHLNRQSDGLNDMRRTIDAWWPLIESGAEAIVMTASGCGASVREYGHLLADDPAYADKAARVSALCVDLAEVIGAEDLSCLKAAEAGSKVAFHPPCTLQHGQKKPDVVEPILNRLGYTLTPIKDKHLCCGSAGTYSLLQADFSEHFKKEKVAALEAGQPDVIASANIGCLMQIQSGSSVPVKHWIELIDSLT